MSDHKPGYAPRSEPWRSARTGVLQANSHASKGQGRKHVEGVSDWRGRLVFTPADGATGHHVHTHLQQGDLGLGAVETAAASSLAAGGPQVDDAPPDCQHPGAAEARDHPGNPAAVQGAALLHEQSAFKRSSCPSHAAVPSTEESARQPKPGCNFS